MKLSQLASKPKLVKLIMDDAEIIEEFKEPLEFYVYDRQDMDTFMQLASIDQDNFGAIVSIINKMILDENGKAILTKDVSLPMNVMLKVIDKVVNNLGNAVSRTMEA